MINQESSRTIPNNPKIITFPDNKPILLNSNNLKLHEQRLKKAEFDPDNLHDSINFIKNIKGSVEIIDYLINYASKKNAITFIQDVIITLFNNYKYEEFKDNRLLNKYEITKLSEKVFEYKIGKKLYRCSLKAKENNNLEFKESTFFKIKAMCLAINVAIKSNHKQTAEELIKELLKTADVTLTLFSRSNYDKYENSAATILGFISLLEPEAQIHASRILEKHIQQNFCGLSNFSNSLLSQGCFDEAIELLESKLVNIDNEDLANKNVDIGNCYYNLGLAYYKKADYQSAKKYYLHTLKYLPNDLDTTLDLYKIHTKLNEIENAKNYINNLESKDIKILLEIALDLPNISASKLKLINKAVVPPVLHFLIQNLEYIAKFNENKFSSADKIKVFKKLLSNCSDDILLLSTALYTRQYNFAKEIIPKIPKEESLQNKSLCRLKALLGLWGNSEDIQIVIDKNNLAGSEATDIINISNTVLIASGDSASVPQKVENALKYDYKNENTLEIGIAAALLNNNQDKAKEYANQLNEEKQQEIFANYSQDNKAENIEELIEQYDAKEIHAYYQRIKQQKILEISQKITNDKIIGSWNIEGQRITTNDVTFVGKYKGLNCFAKIKEEILNKLDNNLIDSFTNAISKGITYCQTSINGIKFLQNKVVENGDMRLFTNIIYKNSQEELLIDFDNYGNHSEVERFANDYKLEIIGNVETL
ncbi:tetratricopeptide repeat protein [Rickettsia endosymbiont of Pantilius tunicatus]|uniref:tetratricopeptide repeat protein n=1 Tax=Rickettsia endosymbiont of Pantilius tunicatus TaxID=3066267 RepID=UPI00376ED4C7